MKATVASFKPTLLTTHLLCYKAYNPASFILLLKCTFVTNNICSKSNIQ